MRSFAAWSVLVIAVLSGAARAESTCPPLTLVASVAMRVGDDDRAYVPVRIGDSQKSMLIDTGGFFTEMSQAAADELKLSTRHSGLQLIGVAGDSTDVVARAPFAIGNLRAASMDFMVMPSVHEFASDISDAAGVIAPNLLHSYDVDFDFNGGKFNLLSQNHCEGKVVYWPAEAVAVVPIEINSESHILLPVTVDGHRFKAMLDTGASNTVFNLEIARSAFSLTPGNSETPVRGSLQGSPLSKTYTHHFASLSLEGIAVSNLQIELIPDLMRNRMMDPKDSLEGGTRLHDPNRDTGLSDMILGMDILRHLHVYIAYKEKKLYLTPASAPAPATQPGPQPVAATAH
jgi:predicted aspartyl protease